MTYEEQIRKEAALVTVNWKNRENLNNMIEEIDDANRWYTENYRTIPSCFMLKIPREIWFECVGFDNNYGSVSFTYKVSDETINPETIEYELTEYLVTNYFHENAPIWTSIAVNHIHFGNYR